MIKRIAAIVLSMLMLLGVSSCGFMKGTSDNTDKTNGFKLNYVTTNCKSIQAREKISVVDGKVYRIWMDVKYNSEGRAVEIFYLDVYENGSWENISCQEEIEFEGAPYFVKSYTFPLCEKVGNKIVYTDSQNDFYILDNSTQEICDLEMNLEDWRAFATDGKGVFAVLSSFTNKDGEAEIRIYTIS